MEMKKVFQQEGRDAKNLLVYQLCVDVDSNHSNTSSRKPPMAPKSPLPPTPCRKHLQKPKNSSGPRVRSASTGRDKKSELQARYWALLFGNLQRAVNEIYQTVECYENISACQETILVLENHIREFKALAEWFRVSWNYEATPHPQRPQSLAWEVRKSNPAPRVRARSLTSPTVSGKSSPSYSGKSSPCSAADDKSAFLSPRKHLRGSDHTQKGATRVNIRELFSSKSVTYKKASEVLNKLSEPAKQCLVPAEKQIESVPVVEVVFHAESQATREPEHHVGQIQSWKEMVDEENNVSEVRHIIGKVDKYAQTDLEDENLTLAEMQEKIKKLEECGDQSTPESECSVICREPTAVELTMRKLDLMENEFLLKDSVTTPQFLGEEIKKFENVIKKPEQAVPPKPVVESFKKCQSSPLKYSSVLNRPPTNNKINVVAKVNSTRPIRTTNSVQSIQRSATITSVHNNSRRFPSKQSLPTNSARITPASNRNPSQLLRNSSNLTKCDQYGPSNVANRMSVRSKTMIDINSKNARPFRIMTTVYSRKSSADEIGSSTSTLKASNELISGSRLSILDGQRTDQERRSEPKQMPNDVNNDGWLTVKNRRRTSLHWANRFHQPTGYASLPTLPLFHEKDEHTKSVQVHTSDAKKDNKKINSQKERKPELLKKDERVKRPEIKNAKAKVNSMPTRQVAKPQETVRSKINESAPVSRQSIIKRQKSDLTGLKMTSLHKEYMRSEKLNHMSKSSRDSPGASTVEPKDLGDIVAEDFDQNKIDIKIQTNREFSKTIGDLYESLNIISNGTRNEVLSSCDECEEKEDFESDDDQRKLLEEEESLQRQIRELQNTEIDVDTETDETDIDVMIDQDENQDEPLLDERSDTVFVDDENLSLEMRYQALLSGMSWGEREEALATLQAYVSRHPGRAQELHQKLSSPSRRRSLQETLKKYQAKQARAQQKRETLQKEKALKIQQLLARVEDVKAAKQQLIEEKRLKMEERLQRAVENRNLYLRHIVEKAHDEEKKLKEINFIKNIEAQNKRLDLLESSKETEGRLQDLEQERQKRVEEKAAKEAAVERRRLLLERERQLRFQKMNETRLEREQRIGKMQELKEKQRQAMAREKARDREERLLALQVQQQQTTEELQRKILQKQKESARRHEENIEHIRQRALELTIPSRNLDENGLRMQSEDREEGDMSSTVSDVSKEHSRGFKKKMKKLRQRMTAGADEYIKELQPVPSHMRRDSQVPKLLNVVTKGGGPQGMDRPLGQLIRLMEKSQINDFQCFWLLDGLGILSNVISEGMEPNSEISKRSVVLATQLYRNVCTHCPQIARHSILGNSISIMFDALFQSLQLREEKSSQNPVELSTELMLACTVAISPSNSKKHSHPKILERLPDLISYAVITGLVEILARRCMKIRESVEDHQSVVLSLLATLGFLTKFVDVCPPGAADSTKFLLAAKSTELFGSVSMLYSSVVPIGECIPPRTISLAASTFNLLVSMAVLDLPTFQEIVSEESLSLKLLDVITILLKYCGHKCAINEKTETQAVIVDLIATIGFFCANNRKNQDLLASEQSSVIIKSLTKLPEHFNVVVYPCLVTITFRNDAARMIISRDFNLQFLDEYSKSEKAKKNHLIAILKPDV